MRAQPYADATVAVCLSESTFAGVSPMLWMRGKQCGMPCAGNVEFMGGQAQDRGWGCGYQNMRMLISHLRQRQVWIQGLGSLQTYPLKYTHTTPMNMAMTYKNPYNKLVGSDHRLLVPKAADHRPASLACLRMSKPELPAWNATRCLPFVILCCQHKGKIICAMKAAPGRPEAELCKSRCQALAGSCQRGFQD